MSSSLLTQIDAPANGMQEVDAPVHGAPQQGGVWAYISPSRLSKWLSCPLAFKLQYVDGHRPPATPSLLLGKLVHAGLEIFYRHRQLDVHLAAEDVAVRMRGLWPRLRDEAGLRFDTPKEEDALQAQGVALVQTYLAQADKTERPLAVELAIEAPLVNPATGEDLGLPMLGIIDLVVHGEAGPTIVDFKTAARGGEAVELLHELQLSSYAFLVRQSLGLPEAALEIRSLIKTKVPKVERHTYPAREMRHFGRLFAVLRAYVDAINIGRFHYRPGFHCQCCDFRETQCRGWCG